MGLLTLVASSGAWPLFLGAQSPLDIFSTHYGASRSPAVADQEWLSFSAMLLTEFDGRFEDPEMIFNPPSSTQFIRHDSLYASVGYNYITWGKNHVVTRNFEAYWPALPPNSALTFAWSIHGGWTHDELITQPAQVALHDFRGVAHNRRGPTVRNWYPLGGFDVQALIWPETRWFAFGGHLSVSSFLQEQGLTVIFADRFGATRADLTFTAGALTKPAFVGPKEVRDAMDDGYFAVRASVEQWDNYGISAGYSSGIFPGEREFLLSFFVAAQMSLNSWLRFEFVNDLLGNKDRGPTGGARIALARTF